jgi:hypothetical protein
MQSQALLALPDQLVQIARYQGLLGQQATLGLLALLAIKAQPDKALHIKVIGFLQPLTNLTMLLLILAVHG